MIFLLVFNPILQKLKENLHKGYKIGEVSTVTTPYADDFCLISTHKTTHQNLINNIHSQISSMGMKLKPSKCRSFSISGGQPKAVPFHIGDNEIASIRDDPNNFLGNFCFSRANLKTPLI